MSSAFVLKKTAGAWLAAGALVLGGCAAIETKNETIQMVEEVKKGPESAPFKSITGFSAALRCMDGLFAEHGVRDVSVLVEDIVDSTKKVSAGTKDMLASAVSDMTRRSHAIRLIHYGQDTASLIGFMQQAKKESPYQVLPQYDIKGSISQFDEGIARANRDVGIGVLEAFNIGAANQTSANVVALDLAVLTTNDMAMVPGATSRNSVVVYKTGRGVDGDAQIRKFGINYSMTIGKTEGQSQALRGLVELAVIEIFGKLTKVPYWTCLGTTDKDEVVRNEISDWFAGLYRDPQDLIAYFQHHTRLRGFYDGKVDGEVNDEFRDAIVNLRGALDMPKVLRVEEELFRRYLNANFRELEQKAAAISTEKKRLAAANADPFKVAIESGVAGNRFAPGQTISMTVKASRDAYVYCYMQDENRAIQRFFPNRYSKDAKVTGGTALVLPGKLPFQIFANQKKIRETVACYATSKEVLADLPTAVRGTDFEPLQVASLDEIRKAFTDVSQGTAAEGVLPIEFR